jgi:hypothetical protein
MHCDKQSYATSHAIDLLLRLVLFRDSLHPANQLYPSLQGWDWATSSTKHVYIAAFFSSAFALTYNTLLRARRSPRIRTSTNDVTPDLA